MTLIRRRHRAASAPSAKGSSDEPDEIENMFEHFRWFNIAHRSYSADWRAVWRTLVDRQVCINADAHNKARAREYWNAA